MNIFGFSFRTVFKDITSPNRLGEEDHQTSVVYCINNPYMITYLTWTCCGMARNTFHHTRILAFSVFKVLVSVTLLIHVGFFFTHVL